MHKESSNPRWRTNPCQQIAIAVRLKHSTTCQGACISLTMSFVEKRVCDGGIKTTIVFRCRLCDFQLWLNSISRIWQLCCGSFQHSRVGVIQARKRCTTIQQVMLGCGGRRLTGKRLQERKQLQVLQWTIECVSNAAVEVLVLARCPTPNFSFVSKRGGKMPKSASIWSWILLDVSFVSIDVFQLSILLLTSLQLNPLRRVKFGGKRLFT